MHRDSADVIAAGLALADVQTGAHLDPESLHRAANHHGAADRSQRAVGHRKEPVARRVHLAARKPRQLEPGYGVVRIDQGVPATVTQLCGPTRRVHDVGEQDGGAHPIIGHVSRLLFPTLSAPTATLWTGDPPEIPITERRGAVMPRRRNALAHSRSRTIEDESKRNRDEHARKVETTPTHHLPRNHVPYASPPDGTNPTTATTDHPSYRVAEFDFGRVGGGYPVASPAAL